MKFDAILMERSAKGVDVRERYSVIDLVLEDERVVGVVCVKRKEELSVRSRYVLDASGHTSPIAKHAGERLYSQFFRNIAVFGYFHGAKRLPAQLEISFARHSIKAGCKTQTFLFLPS